MASEEHIPAYVQEHGPLEIPLRLVRFDECIAALRLDPGWQRGEREVDAEIAAGQLERFSDDEEFLAALTADLKPLE